MRMNKERSSGGALSRGKIKGLVLIILYYD